MTCDERSRLLLLASLDALEPEEQAELERLLALECPPREAVQAEIDAALAQLALALPPVAPPPTAKRAFLAQLDGAARPTPAVAPPAPSSSQAQGPGRATTPVTSRPWQALPVMLGISALILISAGLYLFQSYWRGIGDVERFHRLRAEAAVAESAKLVGEAKTELARLSTALATNTVALAERDHRLADAGTLTDDLRAQVAKADAASTELEARRATLERELAAAKASIAADQTRLAELGRTSAETEGALVATRLHEADLAKALDDNKAQLALRIQELTAARTVLTQADAVFAALRSPQVKLATLAGTDKQPQATARIVWDQQRGVWHLIAERLAPCPAGKTYELWFITKNQQKVAAITFDPDAQGNALVSVAIPAGLGPLAVAAITDEPAGGVAAPTGSIQLAGQL